MPHEPQKLTGRVLVLGDDTRSFLTVVRSLGRSGLEVHAAWCPSTSPSLRSRYLAKAHCLPAYTEQGEIWLDELLRLLRRERFDLVIPIPDTAILPLQQRRCSIEKEARLCLINDHAFEVTFSKRKTYDLAVDLGIRVPRQRAVRSGCELNSAAMELGFPLVVKPDSSFTTSNLWSRRQVVKLRNQSELDTAAAEMQARGELIVQENFIGVGFGIGVLSSEGRILTAFQHQRLHEPMLGGGSSYRRSVPLNPELFDAATKFIQALNYTGVALLEFKLNPKTSDWILVEVNGRFWGSLPLAVAAGVDFPRFLYELLCEKRTCFPRSYRTDQFARNWVADWHWLRHNVRADRSDPTLMTVPLRRLPGELLNLIRGHETSDTFCWDDPAPALAEVKQTAADKLLPRVRRLGIVRRRMEKDVRLAAAKATKILFLCNGNVGRSPFAELVLRKAMPDGTKIRSAGYHPYGGRSASENGIRAAFELGIDLSRHRSRTLDARILCWADLILLSDSECERFLRSRFPDVLGKTHYLGALDASGPLEIADPVDGGIDEFRGVYRNILKLIERLREELAPGPEDRDAPSSGTSHLPASRVGLEVDSNV